MATLKNKKQGDFIFLLLIIVLIVFGLIMVFSASYYDSLTERGNPYYFLLRQGVWIAIGTVFMVATFLFDYRYYKKLAYPFMMISVVLLLLIFTPMGLTINGATRWLNLKVITLMPGEIAKLAVILFAARFLSEKPRRIKSLIYGVFPLIILIGIVGLLIMKQPNLSTAFTVSAAVMIIMFVAGMRWSHIGLFVASGAILGYKLILGASYRMTRLTTFLDPFSDKQGAGYQTVQSLIAVGTGGIFGLGLGKSVQKSLYLPEANTDFIFAIVGEELGFIGCVFLIVIFALLIWRGVRIAIQAPDLFGCLVASGITGVIAVQTILNIAVVTASIPATGVALPFISWGGNSLVLFMTMAGIMLNISKRSVKG